MVISRSDLRDPVKKREYCDRIREEIKLKKKRSYKKKKKKSPREEIEITKNVIHMFTDGSTKPNPGPSGSGCILLYNQYRKNISKYLGVSTNNIAELTAIKIGLEAIKPSRRCISVVVYTDSQYCMGMLSYNWNAKKNHKLIHEIKTLTTKFKSVKFKKVKAHCGIKYNEEVDKMAKRASGVL